jgi:hypothetical protein
VAADWSRFSVAGLSPMVRAALDSLPGAVAEVRRVEDLAAPSPMVAPLARVVRLMSTARDSVRCGEHRVDELAVGPCDAVTSDLVVSLETTLRRARAALLAAAGVLVEATAPRELLAVGDTLPVTITLYNQGHADVTLLSAAAWTRETRESATQRAAGSGVVAPDSAARVSVPLVAATASVPWWLAVGRRGDVFIPPAAGSAASYNIAIGEDRLVDPRARAWLRVAGASFATDVMPIVYRYADPARGERRRPIAAVPAINVLLDDEVEYARAGVPFDRVYSVHLRSTTTTPRGVSVALTLPAGLRADSLVRRAALEPFGATTLTFRVRGALPAGRHAISATATSGGETFVSGYVPINYEHIRPLRYYRAASVQIEAVDATLPPKARVVYISGVGDNVAPMLSQLGLIVTTIAPEQVATADLSRYGAVVVGPRAFAASSVLAASAGRLQDYARAGGTVVVQYGQKEMEAPGILPYSIALAGTAARVTDETAPVRVLDPGASLLRSPNRITPSDFEHWVQERAVYMPSTIDPHYRTMLEMHDPGEAPNEGAVLVAPLGKGAYVYTTLALFRQLPAGVPGAARIFLNLLAADGRTSASAAAHP